MMSCWTSGLIMSPNLSSMMVSSTTPRLRFPSESLWARKYLENAASLPFWQTATVLKPSVTAPSQVSSAEWEARTPILASSRLYFSRLPRTTSLLIMISLWRRIVGAGIYACQRPWGGFVEQGRWVISYRRCRWERIRRFGSPTFMFDPDQMSFPTMIRFMRRCLITSAVSAPSSIQNPCSARCIISWRLGV